MTHEQRADSMTQIVSSLIITRRRPPSFSEDEWQLELVMEALKYVDKIDINLVKPTYDGSNKPPPS
jgi:hypothetical protein